MQRPNSFTRLSCILLILSSFFLCLPESFAYSASTDPLQMVKESVDSILNLLKDPQLAGEDKRVERKRRIVEKVEERFDFREMSRRTLASNWKAITSDQQNEFVDLFTKLLEDTYIAKIEQYSGEEILYKGQEIRGSRAVVESSVIHNGVETPLIYRLKNSSGQWLVYDVVIEGVSLVNNYRSQFAGVLEKEKFSGLMAKIEQKIDGKQE